MFENVLGHENEKNILKNDIKNRQASHAYLFSGPDGIGKKLVAMEFAKELLKTDNLSACVDYKFVEKLPDKKEILVEQIRNSIVNDIYVAPATCDKKVYVINDAENLNISAQNALLKTLEEPPKHVVIILITSSEEALLTTILSRVKKISFNRLKDVEIEFELKRLLNKELNEDKLKYADGSLKIAIDLANDENDNKYNNIEKLYSYIKSKDKINAIKEIENISFKDDETFRYLEYLLFKDEEYNKIDIVEYSKKRMKQNANEDMVKQSFLIKIM